MLSLLPNDDTKFCWLPNDAPTCVSQGSVHTLFAKSSDGILAIQRQAQALFPKIRSLSFGNVSAPSIRLFGAFPFSSTSKPDPIWRAFGQGIFFLPRWSYENGKSHSWLRYTVHPQHVQQSQLEFTKTILQQTATMGSKITQKTAPNHKKTQPDNSLVAVEQLSFPQWEDYLDKIHHAIASDSLQKVVAARRAIATMQHPLEPDEVLARLHEQNPEATCFFFHREKSTFLGASPETLLIKQGPNLRTESLAGSIVKTPDPAKQAETLLQSTKDQLEHRYVRDHLVSLLRQKCISLLVPQTPSIKPLRHLLHLHTPIEGQLRNPHQHILSLVQHLHPTPALGGLPKEAALSFINTYEPTSRGLYGGPIGWFDDQGNGHFAVAIRSALLSKNQAFLYTGAGIVKGSDPQKEYEETALKQKTMLQVIDPHSV